MYKVNQTILENYAKVLVHYALNKGEGIKKGETVWLCAHECANDLFMEVAKAIWQAGGNMISHYLPNQFGNHNLNRSLLEIGSTEQLSFFPKSYYQGITDSVDHIIFILSEFDAHHLEGISSEKISLLNGSLAPFKEMREAKYMEGKLGYVFCLYGTESFAQEADFSIEEYWEQISKHVIWMILIPLHAGRKQKRRLSW